MAIIENDIRPVETIIEVPDGFISTSQGLAAEREENALLRREIRDMFLKREISPYINTGLIIGLGLNN